MRSYDEIIGDLYLQLCSSQDAENELLDKIVKLEKEKRILEDHKRVLRKFLSEKNLLEEYEISEYYFDHGDGNIY